jgi:5'-nucleotidase/UDP-sugar diphosphatase
VKLARPIAALAGLTLLTAFGCQDNTKSSTPPAASLSQLAPDQSANADAPPVEQPLPAPPVNTVTPEDSAPVSLASDMSAPQGGRYTIKHGDTLYGIAASHYGSGRDWKKIMDANPGLQPSHLRVGQTIILP